MADFLQDILDGIDSTFTTNGVKAITGALSNADLKDSFTKTYTDLRSKYQYMGIASTSSNPGSLNYKAFFLCPIETTNKTYSHIGGIVVNAYELAVISWNLSAWVKQSVADLSALALSHTQNTDTGTTQDNFNIGNNGNSNNKVIEFAGINAFRLNKTSHKVEVSQDGGTSWFPIPTSVLGTGDVVGPNGGVADNEIIVFDGESGKLIKGSGRLFLDSFTEYGKGAGSYSEPFTDGDLIKRICVLQLGGSPSIKIGTTAGGTDILPLTLLSTVDYNVILDNVKYFRTSGNIYYTVSGGSVDIRFDKELKIFNMP